MPSSRSRRSSFRRRRPGTALVLCGCCIGGAACAGFSFAGAFAPSLGGTVQDAAPRLQPFVVGDSSTVMTSHSQLVQRRVIVRGAKEERGDLPSPLRQRRSGALLNLRGAYDIFLEVFVYSTVWMAFSLASLVPFMQLSSTRGGVTSLAAAWAQLDWRPFLTGAAESIAVYTLDHLRDIEKAGRHQGANKRCAKRGLSRFRRRALRVLFAVSVATFSVSLASSRSARVLATFVGHLMLCVGYAKMKPNMPYMKAAYVSCCVVFLAVAAPWAYVPGVFEALRPAALLRLCMLIFCVAFTVEHLQDLRDVSEDQEAGVVTLPSGLGVERGTQLLLAVQLAAVLVHLVLSNVAGLPLRLDMLAVYAACAASGRFFVSQTPRSLFQVALEPLYVMPLAALVARSLLGAPL